MSKRKSEARKTIKLIARLGDDGVVDVRSLIRHPMDSGFAYDSTGAIIPPHYIETISFKHKDKLVFRSDWGPAISKDPFLGFGFRGGKKGDPIEVHWADNEGESGSATFKIE